MSKPLKQNPFLALIFPICNILSSITVWNSLLISLSLTSKDLLSKSLIILCQGCKHMNSRWNVFFLWKSFMSHIWALQMTKLHISINKWVTSISFSLADLPSLVIVSIVTVAFETEFVFGNISVSYQYVIKINHMRQPSWATFISVWVYLWISN